VCLEDAQVHLDAILHHAVGAVSAAVALRVALVDGFPGAQSHLALLVVGHAVQRGARAAAVHRRTAAVLALTAQRHLVEHDALAHAVVVDVGEVQRRALQVHLVQHQDVARVAPGLVEVGLPAPQAQALLSPLDQGVGRLLAQPLGHLAPLKLGGQVLVELLHQLGTLEVLLGLPGVLGVGVALPLDQVQLLVLLG